MYKAAIKVILKPGVLDPQGKAVASGLASLGFSQVKSVRVGKYIEVLLDASSQQEAAAQVEEMAKRLLANPVIEHYELTVELVDGGELV